MENLLKICLVFTLIIALSTVVSSKNLRKVYTTKPPTIPPCAAVTCGFYAICEVKNGKAHCVCNADICPAVHSPVCGTDGITYSNECLLKYESCRTKTLIKVAHEGECGCVNKVPPCTIVKCGYQATCEVKDCEAKCVCDISCTEQYTPVCGTDGVTYSNECFLTLRSCQTQTDIKVAHNGECDKRCPNSNATYCFAPCVQDNCEKGQICCCSPGDACGSCKSPVVAGGTSVCPDDHLICESDDDCAKDYECCPNGCTNTCMPKAK